MMRSLYAGVSGLQNHQTRMDVIGNNISNVNTYGFKKGRVDFQDMISQQIAGSARPTDEVGGVNPKEVGLGMSVASIDTIFTQGNLQSTGVATDIAIQGNGFFVLKKGDETIGLYDTMTEAFYYKKLLMDNDWDRNVLKTNITEKIDVNIVIDQSKEYKVQLNFCPKCKNRLKIGAEDCPSCGINIKEYLFNN